MNWYVFIFCKSCLLEDIKRVPMCTTEKKEKIDHWILLYNWLNTCKHIPFPWTVCKQNIWTEFILVFNGCKDNDEREKTNRHTHTIMFFPCTYYRIILWFCFSTFIIDNIRGVLRAGGANRDIVQDLKFNCWISQKISISWKKQTQWMVWMVPSYYLLTGAYRKI